MESIITIIMLIFISTCKLEEVKEAELNETEAKEGEVKLSRGLADINAFKYGVCVTCKDKITADKIERMWNCALKIAPKFAKIKLVKYEHANDREKCAQKTADLTKSMIRESFKAKIKVVRVAIRCYFFLGMMFNKYDKC